MQLAIKLSTMMEIWFWDVLFLSLPQYIVQSFNLFENSCSSAAAQNHTQSLSTAVDNKLNSLGWVRVWLMRLTLNSTVHIFFQEYIKSVFKTHFLTYRTPASLSSSSRTKEDASSNEFEKIFGSNWWLENSFWASYIFIHFCCQKVFKILPS